MNPDLSRRVASLMQVEPIRSVEFARRRELAALADTVDDVSLLPDWATQLITAAEANLVALHNSEAQSLLDGSGGPLTRRGPSPHVDVEEQPTAAHGGGPASWLSQPTLYATVTDTLIVGG